MNKIYEIANRFLVEDKRYCRDCVNYNKCKYIAKNKAFDVGASYSHGYDERPDDKLISIDCRYGGKKDFSVSCYHDGCPMTVISDEPLTQEQKENRRYYWIRNAWERVDIDWDIYDSSIPQELMEKMSGNEVEEFKELCNNYYSFGTQTKKDRITNFINTLRTKYNINN